MSIDADAAMTAGKKIKHLRLARVWSQEELAHRAAITLSTLQNVEAEKTQPQLQTIHKIAAAFGVDAGTLRSPPTQPATLAVSQRESFEAQSETNALEAGAVPIFQSSTSGFLLSLDYFGENEIKRREFLKMFGAAATTWASSNSLGGLSSGGYAAAESHPHLTGRLLLELSMEDWSASQANAFASLLDNSAHVTPSAVARAIHQWLVIPPPQKVALSVGRRIGERLVAKVEGRVKQLVVLDRFGGGRDLLPIVEREVALTAQLLRNAAYDERIGAKLLSTIANLCCLAAWVAADAGSHAKVAQYTGLGLKAAHAANDPMLAADIVSRFGYFCTNTDRMNDGILYAQTALHGVSAKASATTRALLQERIAWAYAGAGQHSATERALSALETEFTRSNPENDPQWVSWMNSDEVEIMLAKCFVRLGQPKMAIQRLPGILKHYDHNKVRSAALYTGWLSEAHLIEGNIEEAAHHASRAAELTARTTSTRIEGRFKELSAKLRPYADNSEVHDFFELSRDFGFVH